MPNVLISEAFRLCDGLHGHIEYYETILEKNDLISREGEFRSCKLGLTLGLLRMVEIPENLKRSLISELIEAWRLSVPEKTQQQRQDELQSMRKSIEDVRQAIRWTEQHASPTALKRLSSGVMFALPVLPSDIQKEEIPKIQDKLRQIMDFFSHQESSQSLGA
ncbi:MAG: hypothetical protein HPY61_11725 [Methanotrichaceae archaeon]|nr:hypothetical protein [Methanotrichaceae archaeon]